MRRLLAGAAVAVAGALAGCGPGPGEERPAQLLVTRNFGDSMVGREVAEGTTVLRALQRGFKVTTRFGGNFVQSIQGIEGGTEDGRRLDWFFYVNGIESDEGAGSFELSAGDRVWWDHHDWTGAMRIPAVVGSFPEPFLSGRKGERLPVRVDCAASARRACDVVIERLRRAGVTGAATAGFGQPVGLETLRVVVGRWSEIRADGALSPLEEGPQASGVFARFGDRGARLELLDAAGKVVREAPRGSGLVAATRQGDQAPTWAVTGVDDAGLAAAAAAFDEASLGGRFALAVVEGADVALPARTEVQP